MDFENDTLGWTGGGITETEESTTLQDIVYLPPSNQPDEV